MAGGEIFGNADIHDLSASPKQAKDLLDGERGEGRCRSEDGGTTPVDFTQTQEIVRERPQRTEKGIDEFVLPGDLKQRIGGPLPSNGRDAVPARCGGSEGPGTMGGPDRGVIGQLHQPLE